MAVMRSGGQCPRSHGTGRKQEVLRCDEMLANSKACSALSTCRSMANSKWYQLIDE